MKGGLKLSSEWFLCLTAAVLFQHIVTVSAGYSMAQTCAQMSKGFIADPNDCKNFGYCNNGKLVGISHCPNGYVYNARKGECDFPGPGVCSVTDSCQYAADKSFIANPSDCSTYYYCENKVGSLVSCPWGQIFDRRATRCVWRGSTGKNACAGDSICHLLKDGQFVGDPQHCGQYIGCLNGVGDSAKCPGDTYYNKALGGCQVKNPCETPTNVEVGPGVLAVLPTNADVCQKQTTFPSWVSDGQTCMGYYVCESKTGPGIWSKCDPGLHFDNGKCVNAFSVPCTHDRCGNMNQEFVGAVGTGCKNFLICKNQTSQDQTYSNYVGLPCPADYPYFDEYIQRCVQTTPASDKYKLCV